MIGSWKTTGNTREDEERVRREIEERRGETSDRSQRRPIIEKIEQPLLCNLYIPLDTIRISWADSYNMPNLFLVMLCFDVLVVFIKQIKIVDMGRKK